MSIKYKGYIVNEVEPWNENAKPKNMVVWINDVPCVRNIVKYYRGTLPIRDWFVGRWIDSNGYDWTHCGEVPDELQEEASA